MLSLLKERSYGDRIHFKGVCVCVCVLGGGGGGGGATLPNLFLYLSEKGLLYKERIFAPSGSKVFPYRVDIFRRGLVCRKENGASQKLSLL